jgi:SWI/SNF-related matrix-associated actin-dependent regulator of chromatin subfamily A member 5
MDGTKTVAEVEEYALVFFEKVDTLNDAEKIKSKINRAQKNVNFNMRAPSIILNKMKQFENPMEDMTFSHATQKSKYFSRESDIMLVCIAHKCGFGNWSKIKEAVRREPRSRLDHLFVSRSEEELKKRVIYLVQCLEKEEEDEKKKGIRS